MEYMQKAEAIEKRLANALKTNDMADLKAIIDELEIADPDSGSRNWTEVRQFNLMFSTQMSNTGDDGKLYLRPETAQGIFVNFQNVQKTTRQKIPSELPKSEKPSETKSWRGNSSSGCANLSKWKCNISCAPAPKWSGTTPGKNAAWPGTSLLRQRQNLRFKDHDNLAHYANAAVDIQFEFPFGFKELEGIHSRTDFDLRSHSELSGRKLQYFDPELNEHYTPYVVETSVGCDRMFLSVLSNALGGRNRARMHKGRIAPAPCCENCPSLGPGEMRRVAIVEEQGRTGGQGT
jgi:glycyl-tRNA synthetase